MFDIGIGEMVALAIIGLLVFGPERLPRMAREAGHLLRQFRAMLDNAKNDLSESLGPEFKDLDLSDLNPRTLARKHLIDPLNEAMNDIDGADIRTPAKPVGDARKLSAREPADGAGDAGAGGAMPSDAMPGAAPGFEDVT